MSRRHGRVCSDPECPACQNQAESRAEPEPIDDPGGQDQWERYLDRLGES